jgi:hypothetical protein
MVFSPANHTNIASVAVHNITPTRRRFGLVTLGLLVFLVVFYLVQTNSVATKGYEIKELGKQVESLKQSSRKLEVEAAELQSIKKFEQNFPANSFVAVEKIEYLASTAVQMGVAVK